MSRRHLPGGGVGDAGSGGGDGVRGDRDLVSGDAAPDAGVATVFAAFGLLVLLLVAGAGVQIGAAVVARHRVQAAADLAALAGAVAGAEPNGEDPCVAAESVAHRNHGAMTECRVDGADVVVRTEVPVTVLGTAVAQARAGPV